MGNALGLVVKAGDWWPRGRGLEYRKVQQFPGTVYKMNNLTNSLKHVNINALIDLSDLM